VAVKTFRKGLSVCEPVQFRQRRRSPIVRTSPWNFRSSRNDKNDMHCATCRELLSADVDGELSELEREAMDAHVAGCGDCTAFRASVTEAHRSVRLSSAEVVPDLTATILAAHAASGAPARVPSPRRGSSATTSVITFLRYALGVVAATQLVLAVPELLDPDGAASTLHASHHLGAWDIAFAVGLLVVAVQPWRARGLLPMCAALAGVMVVTAVIDVASGRTPGLAESTHVLELTGLALVWQLSRVPWAGDGPARRDGVGVGSGDGTSAPGGLHLLGRQPPGPTTAHADRDAA
jgi:predicted anti-sigma-YlaC factor YlaD